MIIPDKNIPTECLSAAEKQVLIAMSNISARGIDIRDNVELLHYLAAAVGQQNLGNLPSILESLETKQKLYGFPVKQLAHPRYTGKRFWRDVL